MTGVVIIGAGQAGFQVACSLRDKGFTGPIDLVGDEPGLPYQRPPLSKQFLTGAGTDAVTLRPASYFAAQSITLHNSRAVALDRSARTVSLASGARLPYTRLVLATGAANRPLRVPGADLAGVHDLRTLADASVLRSRLESPGNLVVVGAGFIGMEVAAVARSCGHDVTVVESLDRVLARAVSADVSAAVQRHHAGLGTRFRLGTAVTEILGADGRVTGVRCGDDVLDADLVVVGVGVVPSEDLARDSGLEVSDGILVDAHLSTSDPAIFAIGDCARHGPVRLESVQNATDQARCVAQAITGERAPYSALPWFWSHQGKLNLQIAGLGGDLGTQVVRGSGDAFSVFRYQGDRLVCVESVNRPADHVAARKVLGAGRTVTPAQAGDLTFDLKSFAREE